MNKQELSLSDYKQIIISGIKTLYYINKDGIIICTRYNYNKEISRYLNNKGYYAVGLTINGKRSGFLLHRLIAMFFIANPHNYSIVNHINGIPTDNRVDNLEWCTQSYNCKHSFIIGHSKIGERQIQRFSELYRGKTGADCKFSKRVIDISTGIIYTSQSEAASALNIKRSTLSAMLIGQNKNTTNIRRYE